ncbi:unnamed protein product [Allacma fusca]|uniref:Zinc transporter ZIP14 n=1 Tax=Allacma fusca TaxID=39272 RepID=A0A8J2NL74_9HEXA|nr:unnamed protein product [Allacma fusca]
MCWETFLHFSSTDVNESLLPFVLIPPIFARQLRNGTEGIIAKIIQSESSSEDLDTNNRTTAEAVNREYWRQWGCTHSHERFLDIFYAVREANKNKCPLKTDSRNETSKYERDNRIIKRGTADESTEVITDPSDLTTSRTLEHQLKRLRGCKWGNLTHVCHQYILFTILEPECSVKTNDTTNESDFNYSGVTEDVLEQDPERPSTQKVWLYGLVCCTVEIVFARLGVILLPLLRKDLYEKLIITMVGLAAGTLTGSSIFHLLPKAFSLDDSHYDKKYLNRCLVIAIGLWAFLMIERILKIFFHHTERKLHKNRTKKISNVLAVTATKDKHKSVSVISHLKNMDENLEHSHGRKLSDGSDESFATETNGQTFLNPNFDNNSTIMGSSSSQHSLNKYRMGSNELPEQSPIKFQEGSLALVSTQAWMIIVGDSFLDFVDGLSIGTAFHDSILTGFSISLGILLEEFPHELGEFAVLLNAGLSFRQAFFFKLISSCSTYFGLCVGVYLGGVEAGHYVFALAAGMFLYIALVDMVPELNEAAFKSSRSSVFKGVRVLMLQNIGLLLGMSVIYVMALYEDFFKKF